MTYPIPGVSVGTPYGKRGSSWSCNENSSGQGVHTGVDFPCPSGTRIYAPVAGDIRHRSYGSAFGGHQFAISPDPGEPFGAGEVFFAHTRTRLADGTRVEVGDFIAEVGNEGNSTGPHLHLEYHSDTKGTWSCSVHDDPQPVLDHGGEPADSGPYVTEHVHRSKCGMGEPTNGDDFSDTVKELVERLNRISLKGGQTLPVTGVYDADVDHEVRLWQEQICGDTPDPAGQSYLGPNQFKAMFPDSIYELHDDGDPAIAGEGSGGGSGSGTTLGRYLASLGYVVHDEDVPDGRSSTWRGVEFLMVHHTGPFSTAAGMADYIRTGGAYPPLAQILLDQAGEVWMCSRELAGQEEPGRASHAGEGDGYGVPDDTMNERSLGIECLADGSKSLSAYPTLYSTLIQLLADLADYYTVPVANIIGHKEWSSTGKPDPLDDMNVIRADVAAAGPSQPGEPEPPEPPDPAEPPQTITFPLDIEYHYSGKPSGTLTFKGDYKKLDVASWAPKKDGLTFGMLYANVDGSGEFRARLVREAYSGSDDDPTSYQTYYPKSGDNFLLTLVWFESGEGGRKLHYELSSMDGETMTVGTRYAKFVTIPWEVVVAIAELGAAYMYVARPVLRAVAGELGIPWPDLLEQVKAAAATRGSVA